MTYSFALMLGYLESSFITLRPHELALWCAAYFLSIYLTFASFTWCLSHLINQPIETKKIKANQIKTGILDSIRSILIFGIGMIIPWAMCCRAI